MNSVVPSLILTRRELQVMRYVIQGLSAKEISLTINRSKSVVQKRVLSVKRKLKAKNTVHAVALFITLEAAHQASLIAANSNNASFDGHETYEIEQIVSQSH